jgi:hypothetical protein
MLQFKSQQQGQALVILVLVMVVLLAFAAVALDGGTLYTQQRRAQSAADSAALAAATRRMNGVKDEPSLRATALSNAAQNGYTNDGTTNWVTFYTPPIDQPYAARQAYVQVFITQTVRTTLAQLVYRGPLQLTVRAVAHGVPPEPLMSGYALAALKPDCGGESTIGVQGRGGGSSGFTLLRNAGAFVNASCDDAITMSGSHETLYVDGGGYSIDVVGGYVGDCPGNLNPCPNTGMPPVDQDPIKGTKAENPPPCGSNRTYNGEATLQPGRYGDIRQRNNYPPITLNPGIYCVDGTIQASDNGITGTGVLIYLTNAGASIDFSGKGNISLNPATQLNTNCTTPGNPICDYVNIIIYKPVGQNDCSASNKEIDLTGQGSMILNGLIYAPQSLARYGGSGSLVLNGQSLVGCAKFNGNGSINIIYNPDITYVPAGYVNLVQ